MWNLDVRKISMNFIGIATKVNNYFIGLIYF